jgi:hypothetical protein
LDKRAGVLGLSSACFRRAERQGQTNSANEYFCGQGSAQVNVAEWMKTPLANHLRQPNLSSSRQELTGGNQS